LRIGRRHGALGRRDVGAPLQQVARHADRNGRRPHLRDLRRDRELRRRHPDERRNRVLVLRTLLDEQRRLDLRGIELGLLLI
jgi:hypothetical protein